MPADDRNSYVRSAAEQPAPSSVEALAAESFKSIATDKRVNIETRMSAAESLARLNHQAAAESYKSMVTDQGIHVVHRLSAANSLAQLDQPAAAEACKSIAADKDLDVSYRIPAASSLARSDPKAAAPILFSIASEYKSTGSSSYDSLKRAYDLRIMALNYLAQIDGNLAIEAIHSIVMHETREAWRIGILQHVSEIPNLDARVAATMLNSVATSSVQDGVRLTAANLLQHLLPPPGHRRP